MEYGGRLYASTYNTSGCEVWEFDGTSWASSATGGFGDVANQYGYSMAVYDGRLYAGTMNYSTGCEIWAYDGTSWTQSNPDGFGDVKNLDHSLQAYGGKLYAGTYNDANGTEVWGFDGTTWAQANVNGFGDANNYTSRSMVVYQGRLFLGTQNSVSGGGVWGYDGTTWEQVNTGGFGDLNNVRCYATAAYDGRLYVGTYNPTTGLEVWRNRVPVLSVEKAGPAEARAGDTMTYTITINNTGDDAASGVSFTDTIPASTTVVTGSVTCSDAGASIADEDPVDITGISIPVAGSVTISFEVTIDAGTAPGTIVSNQGFAHYLDSDIPSNDPTKPGPADPTETLVLPPPGKVLGSTSWFLAEGSTGGGFDTWVLLQNPQDTQAQVDVVFTTLEGPRPPVHLVMDARSRATLRIQDYVPDDFHVSTFVVSDVPMVAERSMYWDKRYWGESDIPGDPQPYEMRGGHANLGTPLEDLSGFHFFAEGATAGGFDTWVLLCNPGDTAATAQVSLMTPEGTAAVVNVGIPPESRQTFHVNDYLPGRFEVATEVDADVPIAAERSMYWDPGGGDPQPYEMTGGHSNSGSSSAADDWFFAEGSTGGLFETYILVQNPGAAAVTATATFMDASGVAAVTDVDLAPRSRATLRASDYVPGNFFVSTRVTSTGPVAAERSMYWSMAEPGQAYTARGGHSVAGITATGTVWMVPEGSTGGGFDSWVLLANPGDDPVDAEVTFMTAAGPRPPVPVSVGPRSRYTIHVNEYVPGRVPGLHLHRRRWGPGGGARHVLGPQRAGRHPGLRDDGRQLLHRRGPLRPHHPLSFPGGSRR